MNQKGLTPDECRKLSKKLKNRLKTIHSTLPSCSKFQKYEFSVPHETQFSRLGGGGLTQHLWVRRPLVLSPLVINFVLNFGSIWYAFYTLNLVGNGIIIFVIHSDNRPEAIVEESEQSDQKVSKTSVAHLSSRVLSEGISACAGVGMLLL